MIFCIKLKRRKDVEYQIITEKIQKYKKKFLCGGCNAFLGDKPKKNKSKTKPKNGITEKNPGATKFIIKSDYNKEKIEMLLGALIVLLIEDTELKTN